MPKVHPIQYGEIGRLGVDEDNRLYWDEKPLVTEDRITLSWWVNLAVVLGALSTLALALVELLRFNGYGH